MVGRIPGRYFLKGVIRRGENGRNVGNLQGGLSLGDLQLRVKLIILSVGPPVKYRKAWSRSAAGDESVSSEIIKKEEAAKKADYHRMQVI